MPLTEILPRPLASDVRLGDLIKPLKAGQRPRIVFQIKREADTITFVHGPNATTSYPATCRVAVLRQTARVIKHEAERSESSDSHVWFVRAAS